MTNKEYILKITADNAKDRLRKIMDCITHNYIIQAGTYDITNIIVPAKNQENKLTIMAHHDVFHGSKGYNDNSTGVVTLLKLQENRSDNVELVFTDKEEFGGHGCEYYLRNHPANLILPKEAINVDVVGLGNKIFYEQYVGPISFTIPEHVLSYKRIPFSDSHMLRNYGIPNILLLTGESHAKLIDKIFEAQHNGPQDGNLDLISEETMDLVFNTIVGMIKEYDHKTLQNCSV